MIKSLQYKKKIIVTMWLTMFKDILLFELFNNAIDNTHVKANDVFYVKRNYSMYDYLYDFESH